MKQKAWKSTELGLGNSPWHRLGDSSHKQCESRCEIPQVQAYSNPISYVKQTSSINYWVNLARKTQLSVHNSTRSSSGAIYFGERKQLYICQKAVKGTCYPSCGQPGPLQRTGQASRQTHWDLLCANSSFAQRAWKPQLQLCQ